MIPPGTRAASRARCSPTRRFSASVSSTHGPAMRNSASVGKRTIAASVRGFDERTLSGSALAAAVGLRGGGDEAGEEWMRPRRTRLQLGVELTANKPGVRHELDDLDELAVRREAAQSHSVLHEEVAVSIRDFITVTVSLTHLGDSIHFSRARPASEPARIGPE